MTDRRRGRLSASLVILGVIAPWWSTAAVTLHVAFEHDDIPGQGAVSQDAFLHGHRHSAETKDHEHAFSSASFHAENFGFRASRMPAPSSWIAAADDLLGPCGNYPMALVAESATGPPGRIAPLLRV